MYDLINTVLYEQVNYSVSSIYVILPSCLTEPFILFCILPQPVFCCITWCFHAGRAERACCCAESVCFSAESAWFCIEIVCFHTESMCLRAESTYLCMEHQKGCLPVECMCADCLSNALIAC